MAYIPIELRQEVIDRAGNCCEYCLISSSDSFFVHEIDHIIATKHRGETWTTNLCLSCFDCNRYKGSDVASYDIETNELVPLFHPRKDIWSDHFRLTGAQVDPLTATGRITVFLLQINTPDRLARRQELIELGRYPCFAYQSLT
jgi:5-methylcytosine-specific restriction endonuclease McrA